MVLEDDLEQGLRNLIQVIEGKIAKDYIPLGYRQGLEEVKALLLTLIYSDSELTINDIERAIEQLKTWIDIKENVEHERWELKYYAAEIEAYKEMTAGLDDLIYKYKEDKNE